MLSRLLDAYLLVVVGAGVWLWWSGSWAGGPRDVYLLGILLIIGALGLAASFGRGQRLARLLIRAVAAIAVSAVVATMAASVSV